MCIQSLLGMVFYICEIHSSCYSDIHGLFCLLILYVCIKRGGLKSSTIIANFSISSFCCHFCFIYFKVMLLGLQKILNCCVFLKSSPFYSSLSLVILIFLLSFELMLAWLVVKG